ncbi:hypothetical protein AU196_24335 [Mycobacterium sp. IS-1742]|nr:hypothetical protein AU196_24335 [Mycobacterium sp. IS-1742]
MHRLSGFDTAFLLLEGPSQPIHQCSLAELDVSAVPGGYSFEAFRDRLAARADALPEFRAKLANTTLNLGTPAWVEDPDFDIDHHVHRIDVPAPGGYAELCEISRKLATEQMDRRRPMWDIWFIEGLDGVDPGTSGRVAAIIRTHHVFADGVTSGNLWAQLYADADAAPSSRVDGFGTFTPGQIALDGLKQVARRPWFFLSHVLPATIGGIVKTIRRMDLGQVMSSPFAAPPTPFNGDVSPQRTVAYAQLDLTEVEAIKAKFGVKVNDVMMALVSGTLRRYLERRTALPERALIAIMPISIYDESRPSRNQFTSVFSSLHTDIADPVQRLKAIAHANSVAKDHSSAIGSTLMSDWTECIPTLYRTLVRLYAWSGIGKRQPMFNLSFSNVRGFQEHILGAPILTNFPFGPVLSGVGLNITASTLNDHIGFGFVACPRLTPEISDLADGIAVAMRELRDAEEHAA